MISITDAMVEYKKQLGNGHIQIAYQGLMQLFRDLKSDIEDKYPDYSVASSIYYGFMDMTYYAVFSDFLKTRKLKAAVVFLHEEFRFEVWLSGSNRDVQAEYWESLSEMDLGDLQLASNPRTADYILRRNLVGDPHFEDMVELIATIESGTIKFIQDVEHLITAQEAISSGTKRI